MNHPNSNNKEKNESKEEASLEEQQEPPKTSSIPSIKEDYELKMKLKKAKGHHAKASNPGVVSVKGDEVSTAMKKKQLHTKRSPKNDESSFNDSIQGRSDKSQESLQTSTKLSAVNSEKRDDIMMTKKKNISDAQKANKPGVVAVDDVKGFGSLAEKKIRLKNSPKKQNNASEKGSLMSDKTEEGQVDINVVKVNLMKLLMKINEENIDRKDIERLIHDTWKSIQLQNTCECMAFYFILMACLFRFNIFLIHGKPSSIETG